MPACRHGWASRHGRHDGAMTGGMQVRSTAEWHALALSMPQHGMAWHGMAWHGMCRAHVPCCHSKAWHAMAGLIRLPQRMAARNATAPWLIHLMPAQQQPRPPVAHWQPAHMMHPAMQRHAAPCYAEHPSPAPVAQWQPAGAGSRELRFQLAPPSVERAMLTELGPSASSTPSR